MSNRPDRRLRKRKQRPEDELAERRRSEAELQRLNRTLRAISSSNHALLHARDEQTLLDDICRIIVDDCGHPLVWIGLAEPDHTVRPVAHAGFDPEYIRSMNITWDDTPHGRGPTGRAIRTGKTTLARDLAADPAFEPWRRPALQRGYACSLALPLLQDGRAFGALNIYNRFPDAFSDEEVALLAELAADLAFGLSAMRLRLDTARLEAQRLYLASFPEQNPNPITEVDLDGAICYLNPIARRLFPDLIEQKTAHPWLAGWSAIVADFRVRSDQIQTRSVLIADHVYHQTLIFVPADRLIRIYAANITERARLEEALRENEERFRLVLKNMPVVAAALDRDLRFTWVYNPGLGYKPEDVIGRLVGLSLEPQTRLHVIDLLRGLLADGSPVHWEAVSQTAAGEIIYATYAEALRNPTGEIIGAALVSIDITERTRAEQALRESEQKYQRYSAELERSNQALEDFAFVASHDLREPLRKVKSFGDLLKGRYKDALDADANDYIDRMQKATARMQVMLDGILAYSHLATQADPLQPVDLNAVVSDVLSDLDIRISRTGGRVELAPLPTIEADPVQMQQFFQNLIVNSLKYRRPEVPLLIRISSRLVPDNQVEITVADNGAGFDELFAADIFKPSRLLHPRTGQAGAGMGLAICRKIVERLGGTISGAGVPGEGAAISATLPLSKER